MIAASCEITLKGRRGDIDIDRWCGLFYAASPGSASAGFLLFHCAIKTGLIEKQPSVAGSVLYEI